MRARAAWILGLLPALAAALAGQGPATAAAITEQVQGFARVFDVVLPGGEGATGVDRTLVLVLDATPSLPKTEFLEALEAGLVRHAQALRRTKIGVVRVGAEQALLAPSDDRQAVLAAVRQALAAPSTKIQNVYGELRALVPALTARPGARAVLLVTLENGDAEDDLEGIAARLEAARVQVHVLAGEAYVADSYWLEHHWERGPRGTKLTGGDSPHVDLPFGWLFQHTVANEVTPSAHATYGLNRLAAATGGRVFLAPPPDAPHRCSIYGGCLFCSGDHLAEKEVYWSARAQLLAASTRPRGAAGAELAADPCFRATVNAWRAAEQAGIVRSKPPRLSATVGGAAASGGGRTLLLSLDFGRNAERADAAAADCERILAALEAELGRVDRGKANPRQLAIAELTRVLLQLTKVNLITFAGWCREIAPEWTRKDPVIPPPPELWPVPEERRPSGIAYTNYCLCHGVRPFLQVELPGGARLREELLRLDALASRFLESHAHTPFAVALHRQGIARFHLAYPGTVENERERPRSRTAPDPGVTTGGTRPPRAGGGSGGTGGPVTGGK
jgi:hypothetical protein